MVSASEVTSPVTQRGSRWSGGDYKEIMKVKVAAARGAEVASCAAEVPLINVNFSPNQSRDCAPWSAP